MGSDSCYTTHSIFAQHGQRKAVDRLRCFQTAALVGRPSIRWPSRANGTRRLTPRITQHVSMITICLPHTQTTILSCVIITLSTIFKMQLKSPELRKYSKFQSVIFWCSHFYVDILIIMYNINQQQILQSPSPLSPSIAIIIIISSSSSSLLSALSCHIDKFSIL